MYNTVGVRFIEPTIPGVINHAPTFYMKNNMIEYTNRRTIRMQSYDYSMNGAYFVTICTHNKRCMFGNVDNGQMLLSPMGKITNECLIKIQEQFKIVKLSSYIIMPNHLHCVLFIESNNCTGSIHRIRDNGLDKSSPYISKNPMLSKGISLGQVIRFHKAKTTYTIRNVLGDYDFKWQRNYYERVIRDEDELFNICEYIENNPVNWYSDRDNTDGMPNDYEKKFWERFS
jgi:REP element-mobilizing transposase RayT